jgi:hypothetical protein
MLMRSTMMTTPMITTLWMKNVLSHMMMMMTCPTPTCPCPPMTTGVGTTTIPNETEYQPAEGHTVINVDEIGEPRLQREMKRKGLQWNCGSASTRE